jgi:hypothetical protein
MRVKQDSKADQIGFVKQSVKQRGNRAGQDNRKTMELASKSGAGEGTRTLDNLLGRYIAISAVAQIRRG